MNTWAVIPVQPLDEGKSRLKSILNADERLHLNRKFFLHVLDVTKAVFPPQHILVVSRSEHVLAVADSMGARTLDEKKGGDLNRALTEAAAFARHEGAAAILSISCDLPLLEPADLQAMCDAMVEDAAVIAPDRARVGTNALLCPVDPVFYVYGEDSYARHMAQMDRHNLRAVTIEREGLACDIDTPADLEHLRTLKPDF